MRRIILMLTAAALVVLLLAVSASGAFSKQQTCPGASENSCDKYGFQHGATNPGEDDECEGYGPNC